jgi:hypothetical protein
MIHLNGLSAWAVIWRLLRQGMFDRDAMSSRSRAVTSFLEITYVICTRIHVNISNSPLDATEQHVGRDGTHAFLAKGWPGKELIFDANAH